ncbi:hypothetical protein ACU686_27840 [Yinghuangia aomiensis]
MVVTAAVDDDHFDRPPTARFAQGNGNEQNAHGRGCVGDETFDGTEADDLREVERLGADARRGPGR